MNIKELARITKVSVRTLQHYDNIGLLKPVRNPENGYRNYREEDLYTLQQILVYKECGFPLKSIKKIIESENTDRLESLDIQKRYLEFERKKLERMIHTLELTKKHLKGEIKMKNEDKFEGFDFSKNPYEDEARARWGDKAVDESKAHIKGLGKEGAKAMGEEMTDIFKRLSKFKDGKPNDEEAQKIIHEFYIFLNTNVGYKYSYEAFKGLGQMYVLDGRFTENIDKFGEGLAKFMADAMEVYSEKTAI